MGIKITGTQPEQLAVGDQIGGGDGTGKLLRINPSEGTLEETPGIVQIGTGGLGLSGSPTLQLRNSATGSTFTDGAAIALSNSDLQVQQKEAAQTRFLFGNITGATLGSDELLTVHADGTSRFRHQIYHSSSTANVAAQWNLLRSRGTVDSPTAISALDTLGTINFGGHDGTNWVRPASITAFSEAAFSPTERGCAIQFATVPTGGPVTQQAAFRIQGTGNVQFRRAQTMGIYHLDNSTGDSSKGYDLELKAGNKTAGTGNGGDLLLSTGATAGGSKGTLKIQADAELLASVTPAGVHRIEKTGGRLAVKEGTNAALGTATLVAGTVTVNTTAVTSSSRIFVTVSAAGGTQGFLSVTKTAGVSFTVTSTSGSETSTIDWFIVEGI